VAGEEEAVEDHAFSIKRRESSEGVNMGGRVSDESRGRVSIY
jgi:hypothetical protein